MELKECVEIISQRKCKAILSDKEVEALQILLSLAQSVLQLQGVMPKKKTPEELQNILRELGATELHLAEVRNQARDEDIVWVAGKLEGVEKFLTNLIKYENGELYYNRKPFNTVSDWFKLEGNISQIIAQSLRDYFLKKEG